MPTAHISAKKGEIAKVVLMCGDPLRAKYIAEKYFEQSKLVSDVRNMYCYTGTYKGKKISVMGHGMGIPSMAIYSYELYDQYGVETIIRVGTCGSYQKHVKLRDIVVALGACSDSNYTYQFNLEGTFSATGTFDLLEKCSMICKKANINAYFGNIYTSDIFYDTNKNLWKNWARMGCLAVDMETYALYVNAANFNKKSLSILTVSDNFVTNEKTSSKEREVGFNSMMEIALELALEA